MSEEATVEDELPGQETTPAEPTTEPTIEPTTAPEPDDLRQAMTTLAETVNRSMAPRPEPPAKLSPEEEAKLWGVWNPEESDKEFFKKFARFGDDATPEQIADFKNLFAAMQHGLMKQAITGSQNIVEIALARLNQEYAPIKEYVEEARREATRSRFYSAYEALGDERYEGIISAVANTLASKTFEDENAYFKALAEGAAENIKRLIPEFELGEAKKPTKTTGKPPKLPRTSAGGGGGAGKGRMTELQPTGSRNDIDSLEFEE